jgi:glucose uptake protein GlcU
MSTLSTVLSSPRLLHWTLRADAASGIAMGLPLVAFAEPLAALLGLPAQLLLACGLALFPFAALMLLAARHARPPAALVWLVIVGNVAWALGSLYLCFSLPLTGLGQVFVAGQALAVVVLAELEYTGWRRLSAVRNWPDE